MHGIGEGGTNPFERFPEGPRGRTGTTRPLTWDELWNSTKTTKLPPSALTPPGTKPLVNPSVKNWIYPLEPGEEAPKQLLYHGLGTWGDDTYDIFNYIQGEGLRAGWFSDQPAEVARGDLGVYLAVDPRKLPKSLTQRRVYPQDPAVEIVPDWAGESGEQIHIPYDRLEAQDFLSRISGKIPSNYAVPPEDIYVTDELGHVLGKLGRAAKKVF